VRSVLTRARELMPELALRTTFIVGFPGETEAHFRSVLGLMRDVRFDRVGVFPYYPEEGTPAATMGAQVADRTKQARKRRALALQQEISEALNERFVGQTMQVLVEGQAEGGEAKPHGGDGAGEGVRRRHGEWQLVGRTYRDAPEVDGFVLFSGTASPGDIADVRIAGAGPYDLFGTQA
jgi:ribosomal protein S12 methylthiotransferase